MDFVPDFEPKFSGFHDLMKFRVREILLVSSLYDAFVLEEDGGLAERIFSEYVDLNLHFIPRITKVSSAEEAFAALKKRTFDLVITMSRLSDMNPIEFGKRVKELDPEKMVILLTYDVIDPLLLSQIRKTRSIDKVFFWSGESRILLSIIKYVEDLKNVEDDARAGVQVILLIEDSPKYYSLFLPIMYTILMNQTRQLIADGVNDLHRMLRMRARPKILLAENYEEGIRIYEKYKQNLLGIISDVRFPRKGKMDDKAGFKLARKVKKEVPDLPILLQSSNPDNCQKAYECGAAFLNKNSDNLLSELRSFILSNFGFGDFIFRLPDGREIDRARNLQELAEAILRIPPESLEFHARRNHISIWLRARTEFQLADELRPKKVSDFDSIDDLRMYIYNAIQDLLKQLQSGVIKDFSPIYKDVETSFIRIGKGSLGGKGRSIAFLNALIANTPELQKYPDVQIKTPYTFVLGSAIYQDFLERNNLLDFALNTRNDELIARRFLQGEFPEEILTDLEKVLQRSHFPIAVRSSSILEDSQLLPFAGLYHTYMLPNNHPDKAVRLKQLLDAIRLVYASVFFQSPREYVKHTDYRIEEEKMAVIIEQLIGRDFGDIYYPILSGVAQSFNFYPISNMEPEEGIVHLALGLGKIIVEGEQIYRFSPRYPRMNPPYGSAFEIYQNSQTQFYALDLSHPNLQVQPNEDFSLRKLPISRAEKDGTLFFVGSTYSPEDGTIKDTLNIPGPRVITFANILKYEIFPLADILVDLLEMGKKAFGTHVEIEFAANLYREKNRQPEFYLLQIRPLVTENEETVFLEEDVPEEHFLCRSNFAIGNGIYHELYDLVYVDPDTFDISKSQQIARELEKINEKLRREQRHYILLGFGRWGTSDPWLGIPVEWHQVSQAKVIIESTLQNFNVDPSHGSHFFHNLISLRLGYFFIKNHKKEEFIDWEWLKRQKPMEQTRYLKHVRFARPLLVKVHGKSSRGVILKP